MKGDISLFSWVATINIPDMANEETTKAGSENELPPDQREFALTLTHESIHFIQALSTSYMYRSSCLLWSEVQKVVREIQQLSPSTILTLPFQMNTSIGIMLDQMRAKKGHLSAPNISGISATDLIEGAAVYIAQRMHEPTLNNREYLQLLEAQYSKGNLRVYSDAYRLAEWYLGDDIFDIFSVICFLALCSEEPGATFCKYIQVLGRSGILYTHKRLTVHDLAHLGAIAGITEPITAPQEINVSGVHPILFRYIMDLIENPPHGIRFVDFAARL